MVLGKGVLYCLGIMPCMGDVLCSGILFIRTVIQSGCGWARLDRGISTQTFAQTCYLDKIIYSQFIFGSGDWCHPVLSGSSTLRAMWNEKNDKSEWSFLEVHMSCTLQSNHISDFMYSVPIYGGDRCTINGQSSIADFGQLRLPLKEV